MRGFDLGSMHQPRLAGFRPVDRQGSQLFLSRAVGPFAFVFPDPVEPLRAADETSEAAHGLLKRLSNAITSSGGVMRGSAPFSCLDRWPALESGQIQGRLWRGRVPIYVRHADIFRYIRLM
jgi:hypothetical protein